jgi:hypothetical protein
MQGAFDLANLILQDQLPLLQTLQLQLIIGRPFQQDSDGGVEIAMFGAQFDQLAFQFLALGHGSMASIQVGGTLAEQDDAVGLA